MSTTIDGTLYHAKWCGHCVKFIPEWEKFKNTISSMNGNYKGIKITTHEYEDRELPLDGATVNGDQIRGFPTIKITAKKNGVTNEHEYMGKKNAKELFYHITKQV